MSIGTVIISAVSLVRNRNPGPEGQVRVQLALPSEQPICYTQDLSCPNNLNQGVTNESISQIITNHLALPIPYPVDAEIQIPSDERGDS